MTAPARPEALEVECPKCLSEWHEPCHQVTRHGFIALDKLSPKPHAARVRAATEAVRALSTTAPAPSAKETRK